MKDTEKFFPNLPVHLNYLNTKMCRCKVAILIEDDGAQLIGVIVKIRKKLRCAKVSEWVQLSSAKEKVVVFQKDFSDDWDLKGFLSSLAEGTHILN